MTRALQLLDLRPQLTTLSTEVQPKSIEEFQNQVLRPILKFQNPLSLELLMAQPHYRSDIKDKLKLTVHIKALCIESKLKNQLIGLVVGLMSVQEFSTYCQNSKEFNKRILSMQIERYIDQLS